MVEVNYERYVSGNNRNYKSEKFDSLENVADWLFGMMHMDYSKSNSTMGFYMAMEYEHKRDSSADGASIIGIFSPEDYPFAMAFQTDRNGGKVLIHQMKEDGKIIFSDGEMTAGQRFWNEEVKEWMLHCYDRQMHPTFNFAYDEKEKIPDAESAKLKHTSETVNDTKTAGQNKRQCIRG